MKLVKICENTSCKKEYIAKKADQKYCSVNCRANTYYHLNKNKKPKKLVKHPKSDKKLIKLIYDNAPEGYIVEHIILLYQGGFNHEENLHYVKRIDEYTIEHTLSWKNIVEITEDVFPTCKICGQKLHTLSKSKKRKDKYCSIYCLIEEPDFINDCDDISKSLNSLSKKYNVHISKVNQAYKLLEHLQKIKNKKIHTKTDTKYGQLTECPACKKPTITREGKSVFCSRLCSGSYTSWVRNGKIGPIFLSDRDRLSRKLARNRRREAVQKQYYAEDANPSLIKLIYQNAPQGYHVDHIIPITKGGLHHEDNLQYLPASENLRKNDKLDYEPQGVIRWQDVLNINTQLTET